MSFATGKDVRNTIEHLVQELWFQLLGIKIPKVFPRMTYEEAMSTYGSDKPDTRLGMEVGEIQKPAGSDPQR